MSNLILKQLSRYEGKLKKLPISKDLIILLPLCRENVATHLATTLGNFSIKALDFLLEFIPLFNEQTNYIFQDEFYDFLFENSSTLCTLNLIIPVQIHMFLVDKFNYNYNITKVYLPFKKSIYEDFL